MKKIAIYGAGGFGREVACLLNKINEVEPTWDLVGFFDDGVTRICVHLCPGGTVLRPVASHFPEDQM